MRKFYLKKIALINLMTFVFLLAAREQKEQRVLNLRNGNSELRSREIKAVVKRVRNCSDDESGVFTLLSNSRIALKPAEIPKICLEVSFLALTATAAYCLSKQMLFIFAEYGNYFRRREMDLSHKNVTCKQEIKAIWSETSQKNDNEMKKLTNQSKEIHSYLTNKSGLEILTVIRHLSAIKNIILKKARIVPSFYQEKFLDNNLRLLICQENEMLSKFPAKLYTNFRKWGVKNDLEALERSLEAMIVELKSMEQMRSLNRNEADYECSLVERWYAVNIHVVNELEGPKLFCRYLDAILHNQSTNEIKKEIKMHTQALFFYECDEIGIRPSNFCKTFSKIVQSAKQRPPRLLHGLKKKKIFEISPYLANHRSPIDIWTLLCHFSAIKKIVLPKARTLDSDLQEYFLEKNLKAKAILFPFFGDWIYEEMLLNFALILYKNLKKLKVGNVLDAVDSCLEAVLKDLRNIKRVKEWSDLFSLKEVMMLHVENLYLKSS